MGDPGQYTISSLLTIDTSLNLDYHVFPFNATAGSFTLQLPVISGDGQRVIFLSVADTINTVSLQASDSDEFKSLMGTGSVINLPGTGYASYPFMSYNSFWWNIS
jgi:hypothetical protein